MYVICPDLALYGSNSNAIQTKGRGCLHQVDPGGVELSLFGGQSVSLGEDSLSSAILPRPSALYRRSLSGCGKYSHQTQRGMSIYNYFITGTSYVAYSTLVATRNAN